MDISRFTTSELMHLKSFVDKEIEDRERILNGSIIIGPNRMTRLINASRNGDLDLVKELLDKGDPIDQQDAMGQNALVIAMMFGHYNVMEELLKRGADIKYKDYKNKNLLAINSRFNDAISARILMRYGAKYNH